MDAVSDPPSLALPEQPPMLDRDQLETFATVVEQQSFDRAASVLSITRGAVSQRIKALEESLASDITALIVKVARSSLEPSVVFEPSTAQAGESASPPPGRKAEPQGGASGQEASEQQ